MAGKTKKPEESFEILYRDFMKGVSMKALNARIQNSKKNAFRWAHQLGQDIKTKIDRNQKNEDDPCRNLKGCTPHRSGVIER